MLVINFQEVVEPNRKHLKKFLAKLGPIPETSIDTHLGLSLDVSKEEMKILDSLPPGLEKVRFLNRLSFKGVCWIFFNHSRRICELIDSDPETIKAIKTEFPKYSYCAVACIENPRFNNIVSGYIESGYGHPYVSRTSPLGYKFGKYGLCMVKLKDGSETSSISNETHYVIQQFAKNNDRCSLHLQFSKSAIAYLKSLPLLGHGSGKQKEISGAFKIKKAIKDGSRYVYTVVMSNESDSSKTGEAENVTLDKSLYNFHSHPKEAYERHKVKYGWPSTQDFIGYYDAVQQYRTIFHGVSTLEGLYFISMNEKCPVSKFITPEEIERAYTITRQEVSSPYEFVNRANQVNEQFFTVGFLPWDKAGEVISISYPKFEDNCFVSDQSLESYERLNK